MRTLSVVNQKGGCGKTTTAINLAAVYAQRGERTLLVDLDPQSHCAAGLGVPESQIDYAISDALRADLSPTGGFDPEPLIWQVAANLHLAPSTMALAALEAPGGGLHELPDRDRRLERLLQLLAPNFDRCLIDCPPSIGLLTFNALRATREVIIPVETGYFSMKGAEKQWQTIRHVIERIGRPISCHMLATMHDPDSALAVDILHALQREFAGQLLPVEIHLHEELRQAASMGQAVTEFAPESDACRNYDELAQWLDEHECRPPVAIEVNMTHVADRPGRGWVSDEVRTGTPPILRGEIPAPVVDPMTERPMVSGVNRSTNRAAELAERLRQLAETTSAINDKPDQHGLDDEIDRPDHQASDHPERLDDRKRLTDARDERKPAPETTASASAAEPARHRDVAVALQPPRPAESPAAATMNGVSRVASTVVALAPEPDAPNHDHDRVRHLFGVRLTSRGALFVQPLDCGRQISIAGEFNGWSPTATPLVPNLTVGVAQVLVPLTTGQYRYRVVVDGRWMADPYNELTDQNAHGESNSVVEVPASSSAQPGRRPEEQCYAERR